MKSTFLDMFPRLFKKKELTVKDLAYAMSEANDISGTAGVLQGLASLIISEGAEGEPQGVRELAKIMRQTIAFMLGELDELENAAVEQPASFSITKDAAGKYRWTMITSSSFEDRDGEIVSQAAQEKDVARMNATKEFGYLGWRHVGERTFDNPKPAYPLVVLGKCDFAAMHGATRIESGTFNSDKIGEGLAKAKDLASSLSFYGDPDADGIYNEIQTKGRTVTWKGAASNPLADFSVQKENAMEKTRLQELEELIGKDETEKVLADATAREKDAREQGLRQKESKTHSHGKVEHSHPIAEGETLAKHEHTDAEKESLKEDVGETAADEKKGKETIADWTPDQLKETVTAAFTQVIEAQDTARAKENGELKSQVEKLGEQFAVIVKEVKTLKGDLPAGVKSYRPSQSKESEVTEDFISQLKESNAKESQGAGLIDRLFPELK